MTDSSRYSDKCSVCRARATGKMKMTASTMPEPVRRSSLPAATCNGHYWRDNTAANDGHDDKRRAVLSVYYVFDASEKMVGCWIDINALQRRRQWYIRRWAEIEHRKS